MTRAGVDLVPPDLDEARRILEQARRHDASARLAEIDNESSYVVLYSAAHKAATAALLAAGRRVTAGEDAHSVLLRELRKILGSGHTRLVDRLDRARQQRNRIAYESSEVGEAQLESLRRAVSETIAVVDRVIAERRGETGGGA